MHVYKCTKAYSTKSHSPTGEHQLYIEEGSYTLSASRQTGNMGSIKEDEGIYLYPNHWIRISKWWWFLF